MSELSYIDSSISNIKSGAAKIEENVATNMDTYDNIFDLIAQDEIFQELIEITAPAVEEAPPVKQEMVVIEEYDSTTNIMSPEVRTAMEEERIYHETDLFTEPVPTTITVDGFLSNVNCHEAQLINQITPDEVILQVRSNFGIVTYPGFVLPVKVKQSNRGRKKKIKMTKPRKKQGSGLEFNSQTTCLLSMNKLTGSDGFYKFKIFRTGQIQLPGVQRDRLSDVIAGVKYIVDALNKSIHAGEENPAKLTHAVNVNPVMKNYKFCLKIPDNHIIHLRRLVQVLKDDQRRAREDQTYHLPVIYMIKYTRAETSKVSMKFVTPTAKDPKKTTRFNIFMRGKINILGAFDAEKSTEICEYLHNVFLENDLIVPEGGLGCVARNVSPLDDEDEIYAGFLNYLLLNKRVNNHHCEDKKHSLNADAPGRRSEIVDCAIETS